jgi:voltage-gated potassium channel
LGAFGIYLLERRVTVNFLGDAYWWAVVTVTTVGYGNVLPKTGEGRLVASVLMFVGIGIISALTATLASFFLTTDTAGDVARMEHRLAAMEATLNRLLKERE